MKKCFILIIGLFVVSLMMSIKITDASATQLSYWYSDSNYIMYMNHRVVYMDYFGGGHSPAQVNNFTSTAINQWKRANVECQIINPDLPPIVTIFVKTGSLDILRELQPRLAGDVRFTSFISYAISGQILTYNGQPKFCREIYWGELWIPKHPWFMYKPIARNGVVPVSSEEYTLIKSSFVYND